ncbi:unnamed protein product [Notodromas monacha]|uniref:TGS domain-containing protein n=1 Tax=Notodromas monacha TaxID=399045 RepID=A0A7R9BQE8_9CRUS|nr:unnamed protein product [Notodromas monacha]CAG0918851.1 unnamed protein product [Notodromas monacha]
MVGSSMHQVKTGLSFLRQRAFVRFCSGYTSAANALTDRKEVVPNAAIAFNAEKGRQWSLISRIEKVQVRFKGIPKDCTMLMNKLQSTPFDCAKHLSENWMKRAAIAEVDGKPWDMHRPLESDCELRLISLDAPDAALTEANAAFWRSCAMMLGAVASSSFKSEIRSFPYSFPPPNVRSGSFVYDVVLEGLESWSPSKDELRLMSTQMVKLAGKNFPFEFLRVTAERAQEIMRDNPFKVAQLPSIAAANNGQVTLYKVGNYVDISKGPMIGRTGQLGRCTVTAVRKHEIEGGPSLYRFQGVALPSNIMLNHFAYGLIEERGRKLNPAKMPTAVPSLS